MEFSFLNNKDDINIVDSYIKANSVINNPKYKTILCSISGGSDSDIILDLIYRVDLNKKVKYVWFDTGLEYQATKDHLKHLEQRYNIEIIKERAIKPIPLTCKEYGQPFLSKFISKNMYYLQKHGFKWEDKPIEELLKEYPNCKAALRWWCNDYGYLDNGRLRSFNIDNYKYLKQFLILNPPAFKISFKCCDYAKKNVAKQLIKKYNADLNIVGIRRAEGGIRSTAYKNCYSIKDDGVDDYRPIYWYLNDTKQRYEAKFNVTHSECYTKYGFPRTGCCCCPYGRNVEQELEITRIYEPKLYKAVCNVFKDSYEYTRKYREFVSKVKQQDDNQQIKGQKTIFDYIKDC